MKPRLIISGGGTGGHIFPALAIADAFKEQYPEASVLFVGASNRMEMQRVPKAGYKIKGLWIAGFDRQNMLRNILFPIKLGWSLLHSLAIVLRFRPSVAVGTGGFASGPLLFVASLVKTPSLIQEQNAFPGVTNKRLASIADAICLGSEAASAFFPKHKIVVTGNPIRAALKQNISKSVAAEILGVASDKQTLLVLGGSLGAKKINQLIHQHLDDVQQHNIQLIWQCGNLYTDDYTPYTSTNIHVMPFIDDMPAAYALADVVVSRAGALAISELCLMGKPTLFIPSPNVAENHQEKNAQVLADKEAALLVAERDADEQFWTKLESLIIDASLRTKLGENIKGFARPAATKEILNRLIKLLNRE
ncbi:MAG: undecaprenyldiphospho-muramoylpentapeptide beta-N-acetylglucosaminyltransferase [Flavobacteriaceae bacterium]|nr:undecaprenyldiphospho-muramoylpentapeptide beta-N-acetylglucosaminyltransferase [Flavobacteriaceae bacterium]|tara:strand:+ start:4528 stop:5616 length:1089 start_codon:yes stop_codon:yes gene_type:complete